MADGPMPGIFGEPEEVTCISCGARERVIYEESVPHLGCGHDAGDIWQAEEDMIIEEGE